MIITEYPPLQSTIDALDRGADAYIPNPFDMNDILRKVKEQLKKQEEKKYSEAKAREFIKTRLQELEETTPSKPRRDKR